MGSVSEIKNILKLKETYKAITASLNNANSHPLTFLPARELFFYYISVLSCKSVDVFLTKFASKPFYKSYTKPIPKVVFKCSLYKFLLRAWCECVHYSVNNITYKTYGTSDNKCTDNVLYENVQKLFPLAMSQMLQPLLHINIVIQTLNTVLFISLFVVLFTLILFLFWWLIGLIQTFLYMYVL